MQRFHTHLYKNTGQRTSGVDKFWGYSSFWRSIGNQHVNMVEIHCVHVPVMWVVIFIQICVNICITQISTTHSTSDFSEQILHKYIDQSNITNDIAKSHGSEASDCSEENQTKELREEDIELKLGHPLLKLESRYHVPCKCITEIVTELQFISSSVSGTGIRKTVNLYIFPKIPWKKKNA